jgi:hypothetical protein
VRFADDLVVGFEHREDAERFWSALRDPLAQVLTGTERREDAVAPMTITWSRTAASVSAASRNSRLGWTEALAVDRRGDASGVAAADGRTSGASATKPSTEEYHAAAGWMSGTTSPTWVSARA